MSEIEEDIDFEEENTPNNSKISNLAATGTKVEAEKPILKGSGTQHVELVDTKKVHEAQINDILNFLLNEKKFPDERIKMNLV